VEKQSSLFNYCHINSNKDGDKFVGIIMNHDGPIINFPIGYDLPKSEKELRHEIFKLISILMEFCKNEESIQSSEKEEEKSYTDFPISAYIELIYSFMELNGYYVEKDAKYRTNERGKISWSKTIKIQKPLIQQGGSAIYSKFTIRYITPNYNNLITHIHKFCVFESFSKLGWLFTPFMPEQSVIKRDDILFLNILHTKLSNTNNDKDKRLFKAMIRMIEYLGEEKNLNTFYYGTNRFEYVWEGIIDKMFGIRNKYDYFPKTRWELKSGDKRLNSALEPDTIMLLDDKVYVLDAKYYKFGHTANPYDLPESSSINKQITYAEYVDKHKFKQTFVNSNSVFNAFIIPFNSQSNKLGISDNIGNFGEATGDWKNHGFSYERVQGIVIDTKYLMHNYKSKTSIQIINLAKAIESAFVLNDLS
jgi:hypothetical protein